ncbi:MAG TPA: DUF2889 domain-containing protein [Burkholderiaceae bacterium]|jgi:hypothetical protein|nr:DUF2889 domain-containing protein [Burkholderiaceae bacterium]
MPLSLPISQRALKHRRAIQIDAFARDDGLWDIDAHISDIKTRDAMLASGMRPAGTPLHDLFLRVTIDTQFNIVAAEAASDQVPYPGHCDTIGPAYSKLAGLNLVKGFRKALQANLGDVLGCTHITELALVLPTVAIQAFAGEVFDPHEGSNISGEERKPFQLDRCHALRSDGAAVAKYYPRWADPQAVKSESSI